MGEGEKYIMVLWKGFQKPKRLATDTETLTDRYGRFWAQPFERGFGTTVGKDRKSTRLNSSHIQKSRMPSSA